MVGDVPAKDLSGMHIDDGCHIPEPIDEPEIGEVSRPDDIGTNGTENLEDVRNTCFQSPQVVELHKGEASSEFGLESMFAHDARNGLLVHFKRHGDAAVAVCGMFAHH